MHELAKIKRVVEKKFSPKDCATLLVIDSTLGQNSYEQAKIFHESTHLDGIILTKLDSLAKGGIVFSIGKDLSLPIAFSSTGESIDSLNIFNAKEFCESFLD